LPGALAEVVAIRLNQQLGSSGLPIERDWQRAAPVRFCHDWRGKNDDPQRQTEVWVLWTESDLYLRFRCHYRTIHVFSAAEPHGRRDELWDRDVAEVFTQPDRFGEKYYKEFEVAPNGQWLDLDITPNGLSHITSGMQVLVNLNESSRVWTADLVIPMDALTPHFDPAQSWRVNFFRCEGVDPQRFYSSWQPTHTPEPNFHMPDKFGTLRFER
jgi:Carbohydrate-binding family 9